MKKSKKFVLAGLALLAAITMVLLPLSSCKTEVDTSSPQQEQTDDSTGNNGSTGTGENAGTGSDSNEDNKPEEPVVGTYTVEATAPVNPAEGTITDSKTDSGYTFTADFGDMGSGAYAWFVDGERQQGQTGKEFTWDTSSVAAGVHEIRVEVGGNDARTTVEVKK